MKKEELIPVWQELNEQLYRFVDSKIKDKELSKDIIQDVFVKVFSNIGNLKNQDKLISWIYQITRNEIVTYFRKNKIQFSKDEIPEHQPEDKNLTSEFSICIEPMIDLLPEKYKEALLLSEIKNISQKELAEQLGISYSAAKSRVQRGRVMLKDLLMQCCEISTDPYGNITDYDLLVNKPRKC
ncbi:MAG TPA: RNA polymerase sigma factor SigZ [Saprospiraceae bacterium]|nr:RNA polymerase sigma factor SigZ [Saprospiraceae bacterium]